MIKVIFLFLFTISLATSFAQKNMIPVTQSALTGITLPVGSLQDKRMLSVSAANSLLDMESKKSGRTVSTTEVLLVPSASGFDAAKLARALSDLGWIVSVNDDDQKYAWLQKGSQFVIMYFSKNAKESSLYFALDASGSHNSQATNVNDVQTPGEGINQNQQIADPSAQFQPAEFSEQKETFDIVTYNPPKDWKKEVNENIISYSIVDNLAKTWCQIGIVKSTISKGSIEQDFNSEWTELAAKPFNITAPPQLSEITEADGWKIQSGSGQVTTNNNKAAAILTTFSGYGRCVSIIALTGSQRHLNDIESFVSHIELKNPDGDQLSSEEINTTPVQQTSTSSFAFTTTNFDDGWVATEQADWVQVTKGAILVLIHYPNKLADAYNSVLMDGLKNAWNVLVAPRYSSATNFEFKPIIGWQSIEFAEADAVEYASGKSVHVVLFKMNYSSGNGKYLEFITPDKASFEQEFGAYHQNTYGWEKMENMAKYNKFPVAATDLAGKWTSNFSGAIQYVNASTGFDAGMNTNASAENFYFGPVNTYSWDLAVANGMVGNIKFQSVEAKGTFSLPNNWQIMFSEIEGKPRTYNVYFSCIKDLRVLWLQDTGYGDYHAYAKAE